MHRFWTSLVEPALSLLEPAVIVEIGMGEGQNTANLLEFCVETGAVLHGVDPAPRLDIAPLQERYADRLIFHECRSLDVLARIGPSDAVLVDGDHNWYTVFNELNAIDETARGRDGVFPLVMLHDIGWPYGRRDLYYTPEDIPASYRHAFERRGIEPGSPELLRAGGFNSDFNNAVVEGGERNGVLTAVEDFLAACPEPMTLVAVTGFHGLGFLAAQPLLAAHPPLRDFLGRVKAAEALAEHLEALEESRIRWSMAAADGHASDGGQTAR